MVSAVHQVKESTMEDKSLRTINTILTSPRNVVVCAALCTLACPESVSSTKWLEQGILCYI